MIPGSRKIRRIWSSLVTNYYKTHNPQKYADILFEHKFGHKIDWQNPRDLNEWINYLAFKTDTREWSRLADKYAVREYVASKGLESILIPLYGVWDNVNNIDFNTLPKSFAIKTNHASGNTIIVNDKDEENLGIIRERLGVSLANKFGIETAEPHYLRIKPLVIAEKLLPPPYNVDYKIWCFHGIPYCIRTITNRDIDTWSYVLNEYDLNWQKHPEWLSSHYQNSIDVPRPDKLDEMLNYARILSEGFPEVRVDLYHTPEGIYLGEMTFTSSCGRMSYYTQEHLIELGQLVKKGLVNNV